MKIATIISTILLVIWVILTMVVMWTDELDTTLYIKLSVSMGIVVVAILGNALGGPEFPYKGSTNAIAIPTVMTPESRARAPPGPLVFSRRTQKCSWF